MKYNFAESIASELENCPKCVAKLCKNKIEVNNTIMLNVLQNNANYSKADFLSIKDNNVFAKPFVKWAGGKGQLLSEIHKIYPKELGHKITKYAEPFVGGGAVLFDILNTFNLKEIYISDVNADLINTYIMVRDNVEEVISVLRGMDEKYKTSEQEEKKKYYYEQRDRFNLLKFNGVVDENIEKAVLFIFLNKTCFNGLYRVNKKGKFNVPIGSYKNPLICDEKNLKIVSKLLQGIQIVCADYHESLNFVDENTFVYIDPPYRPLTPTSFTAYNENSFGDEEQVELGRYIDELDHREAFLVISNSDPKNVKENDEFFDDLYKRYDINRIDANRMINSDSKARGKIKELLVKNFEE